MQEILGLYRQNNRGQPILLQIPLHQAQVAGLSVTAASSTQLNLSWTANTEPDLNHYNVYKGTTAGFPVTLGTTIPVATPTTSPYSNTGLSPSTTYYYKVSAVDNAGNIGTLSAERFATTSTPADTTPPAQVAGLSVTAVTAPVNLSWTANTEPDLNHYNVYRGTTAGFPVTVGTTIPVATPTTSPYSNTGLSPSTTYYYKVSAVDNAGNIGPLSTEQPGTTNTASVVFYNVTSPGNSFKNLKAGSTTRYGEEPANSTSIIVGKFIKSLKVRLRKAGNPKGPVNARIRRKTDDAIVATFIETVQSNNLGISFADYTFTLTAAYNITSGDRILIEFSGQNAQHGIDIEIWGTEKFDGANTRSVSYQNSYTSTSTEDMVGTMSS